MAFFHRLWCRLILKYFEGHGLFFFILEDLRIESMESDDYYYLDYV